MRRPHLAISGEELSGSADVSLRSVGGVEVDQLPEIEGLGMQPAKDIYTSK